MKLKKNLANIITCTRILGTLVMALSKVRSKLFYISYIYSGISDVLDGFIARKLNISSDFGRKLDSVSDLFFYTTMMIKIWPYLLEGLSNKAWAAIWITLGVRIALYIFGSLSKRELLSNHTYLNKLTGLMLFFVPLLIGTSIFSTYCVCVIAVAFIAAVYEIYIVIRR